MGKTKFKSGTTEKVDVTTNKKKFRFIFEFEAHIGRTVKLITTTIDTDDRQEAAAFSKALDEARKQSAEYKADKLIYTQRFSVKVNR